MTMPAGKYYIGDLCYVMRDEWTEMCDLFFQGRGDHGCNEGEFNLKDGRRFANFNTAYGDGTYFDQSGREYGVDAGCIGCVRIEDIHQSNPANSIANSIELGHVIEFEHPFTCYADDRGLLVFGDVQIDTDPPYEDEDEDDELYRIL